MRAIATPILSCGLWVCSAVASAQGVSGSFTGLQLAVAPGDAIAVADLSGRVMKGRLLALSTDSIEVLVAQDRRGFREQDVSTVSVRRGDPLRNGALWGLGVGLALLTPAVFSGNFNLSTAGYVVIPLIYGGVGAVAGMGVDALIVTEQTVFERNRAADGPAIQPGVGPGAVGVQVRLGFYRRR